MLVSFGEDPLHLRDDRFLHVGRELPRLGEFFVPYQIRCPEVPGRSINDGIVALPGATLEKTLPPLLIPEPIVGYTAPTGHRYHLGRPSLGTYAFPIPIVES